MSDYIKREDAIRACNERQIISGDFITGIRYPTADEIREVITDIPSADVVERKRGKWTYNLEQGDPISIECPLCGATIYISGDIPDDENYLFAEDYNFCPNCGADMRGNDK